MRKKKVSNSQTTMLSSQTKRQKDNLEFLKQKLNIALSAVNLARHLSKDAGLWGHHLERYPNRLALDSWWLHMELHFSEEYPDAPKIDDYGCGSYREHDPKVDEFVKARAKWILPQLEDEARSYLIEKKNQEAKGKQW